MNVIDRGDELRSLKSLRETVEHWIEPYRTKCCQAFYTDPGESINQSIDQSIHIICLSQERALTKG